MIGLLAVLVLLAAAVRQDPPDPLESIVPRMDTPARQLAHARRLKGERGERPASEWERWTLRAVDAYRAVRRYHPRASATVAEAAFRAGELLAAIGRRAEALDELGIAARRGAGTPFRARARLEAGHLHRRAGELDDALGAYLEVAGDARAAPGHRDDAWYWAGRAWKARGRVRDARRAWRNVAERGVDPVDRLRSFDEIGTSWLEADDLEAAAGVLHECLRALSPIALEETRTGRRVRLALARMNLVEELPKAIESRMRSRTARGSPRKP